jgi:glucose/arabinose dehydrogenase/mono/diheme cytochrome c family protein
MRPLTLFLATIAALAADRPGPLADEVELRPGLLAEYRAVSTEAALVRIDPKPAFHWGNSSPHPRLPPGPFEVTWTGVLDLREPGPVRVGANVGGEVAVTIDGVEVLRGSGREATARVEPAKPFSREPGRYRIRVRFRSLAGVPARVQLWWEGKMFAREPLPAARFKHVPAELPEAAREEERAASGRDAVARLGCARCHQKVFPGVADPPPGPSLAGLGSRVAAPWLVRWLADPAKLREGARMPALFTADQRGLAERTIVAEYLLVTTKDKRLPEGRPGDHRAGQQAFLGLGCIACHGDPEKPRTDPADPELHPLAGAGDRLPPAYLAAFLQDPASRYPDGRMPRLPVTADTARHIAAYLQFLPTWKSPAGAPRAENAAEEEVARVLRRLGVKDRQAAGAALLREKGCARCHPGIGEAPPGDVPLREPAGCLSGKSPAPRFALDAATRRAIAAYLKVAGRETHPSPFAARQRLLRHARCHRCHQRDADGSAPLEETGRTVWAPHLYRLPFQRTPRLTQATARLRRDYLLSAVRDGVTGVRPDWYSYRMPSYGGHAAELVRALAEGDGDLPDEKEPPPAVTPDPTLPALGPALVGFEGYSCVSCHVWAGKSLAAVEPGTVGPELTSVTTRVRREWFDRYLDDPARSYPGTPMPSIFRRGEPAPLKAVLAGDAARQKDAIWAYLALGKKAPGPKPAPPIPIPVPRGEPLVSQIPVQVPDLAVIESLCVLNASHDAIVYDLARASPHNVYTGATLLRQANVWRSYQLAGTPILPPAGADATDSLTLTGPRGSEKPASLNLRGYDRLGDGVRVRWRVEFASAGVDMEDALRVVSAGGRRRLVREVRFAGVPAGSSLELRMRTAKGMRVSRISPGPEAHRAAGEIAFDLPEAQSPVAAKEPALAVKPDPGHVGPLERPGYKAVLYPRPKTSTGEDLVMPSALAVDPRDGRLFVASMKLGDLFVVRDPGGDGKSARFERYANGLFQDVFGMNHDGKDLYVLHRRNLSRLREALGRGDRVDRVAALPHAVGNAYDWAYGLVRGRDGSFLFTFAPHASQRIAGSGSLLRLPQKGKPEEVAFGFRNPLGWCTDPDGEVFFTDNQGDWVATNKLCHVVPGRYYGYPNAARPEHAKKPMATTAVWVPYGWAKSINGVAYDATGGKFGPFAGQFFLAELMHGGAIVRANVEKVNGVYQGACFPFWGQGLLGPLTLAFDPKGRLYVGAITTPGWMGQPDRGALFRLDYTGPTPFEVQSIHARPDGFRVVFTRPADPATARAAASYQVEHYRYEYTGAYGSPEHDRTRVEVRRVELSADGRTADLTTAPLVKGRVYAITAGGVRSAAGEPLEHPTGAYTLNEIPGP